MTIVPAVKVRAKRGTRSWAKPTEITMEDMIKIVAAKPTEETMTVAERMEWLEWLSSQLNKSNRCGIPDDSDFLGFVLITELERAGF